MDGQKLVIMVPGIRGSRRDYDELAEHIRRIPGYAQAVFEYVPHGVSPFRPESAKNAAGRLHRDVTAAWRKHGLSRVVLVGHSLGALLLRAAYLEELTGDNPAGWGLDVERVVLFAAMNRGADPGRSWKLRLLVWLGLLSPNSRFTRDLLPGSRFMTDLRLRWLTKLPQALRACKEDGRLRQFPYIVQLLGSLDEAVLPRDSWDVQNATGIKEKLVANATHGDIVRNRGRSALAAKFIEIGPAFSEPPPTALPAWEPERRVVILHGINANDDGWVSDLRQLVQTSLKLKVIAPSYAPFHAWHLLTPWSRRHRLNRYLDELLLEYSQNPGLIFDFIGHSFGTYLLGTSLREHKALRFDRALLFGSVLPCDFPWRSELRLGFAEGAQINKLRNFCAARDVPVGLFAAMASALGQPDLGFAGWCGFNDYEADDAKYYPGNHDSFYRDRARCRDEVQRFFAGAPYDKQGMIDDLPRLFIMLNKSAPFLAFLVIAVVLGAIAAWIFQWGPSWQWSLTGLGAAFILALVFDFWFTR